MNFITCSVLKDLYVVQVLGSGDYDVINNFIRGDECNLPMHKDK